MKNLTVEYLGYKLEIEITLNNGFYSNNQYIKGTCNSISFSKEGYYTNYSDIIEEFMKVVDEDYFKKKMQENTTAACDILVKQILEDFPNSTDNLCNLLLDFKYKLEEGIGQKE